MHISWTNTSTFSFLKNLRSCTSMAIPPWCYPLIKVVDRCFILLEDLVLMQNLIMARVIVALTLHVLMTHINHFCLMSCTWNFKWWCLRKVLVRVSIIEYFSLSFFLFQHIINCSVLGCLWDSVMIVQRISGDDLWNIITSLRERW